MSAEFNGYDISSDGRPSCRASKYQFGEPGDDWEAIYKALEDLGWESPDDWQDKMICPACVAAAAAADAARAAGHLVDDDGNVIDAPLFEVAS
jgi:hypothetical protein